MAELLSHLHAEVLTAGFRAFTVAPDKIAELGDRPGAYLLALHLSHTVVLEMPKRSRQIIDTGCYVYAGNAYGPGGLSARLRRHLMPAKTLHWHIDHLTTHAGDLAAVAVPDGHECRLIEGLLKTRRFGIAMPGFGSTDCRNCEGHLLSASRLRDAEADRSPRRQPIGPQLRARRRGKDQGNDAG